MISPQLLEVLRCPVNSKARLTVEDAWLQCQQCALRFPIKDGFPVLIVEEAELPPSCAHFKDLPCQREATIASEKVPLGG